MTLLYVHSRTRGGEKDSHLRSGQQQALLRSTSININTLNNISPCLADAATKTIMQDKINHIVPRFFVCAFPSAADNPFLDWSQLGHSHLHHPHLNMRY